MPFPLVPILAGGAFLTAAGFFVDKAGEGLNDGANATIKLAIAGGVAYIVWQKVSK